ncbi:hypothetical protein SOVF_129260 [Spinacia oleracea]|uniref:BURP domain-containing protein BNM2C n=1 Tax=Spinacia oleracea TaxID=3562 RepID=A0A9R0J3V1_SPIOL|nr:BURP domain-containing protein BNM2C-like [Spinacia oleracea]KNA12070.1 hypothetical protein SOVF_129260 [Spinacia oleracea]
MECNSMRILFIFLLSVTPLISCAAIGEEVASNENDHVPVNHHHDHGHSTPHIDHSVQAFFTPEDLKEGNVIPTMFRGRYPSSSSPRLLPREEADSIPFLHSKLPYLLHLFGFAQASARANAVEETLRQCLIDKPIQGETKTCATSLESMLDFVQQIFGSSTKFKALSTKTFAKSGTGSNIIQNYTITKEPRQVPSPKMVACHTLPYPYVVYYCHHQESESKVFKVSLRGEVNNNIVEAISVCHLDTSQWSPNHPSFQVLGLKPGSSPICHFFPADNLVWVPLFDTQDLGYKVLST